MVVFVHLRLLPTLRVKLGVGVVHPVSWQPIQMFVFEAARPIYGRYVQSLDFTARLSLASLTFYHTASLEEPKIALTVVRSKRVSEPVCVHSFDQKVGDSKTDTAGPYGGHQCGCSGFNRTTFWNRLDCATAYAPSCHSIALQLNTYST